MMRKVYISEEQKKHLKKAIAAQDQVGGKVNAGIMDAVCGVAMCEEENLEKTITLYHGVTFEKLEHNLENGGFSPRVCSEGGPKAIWMSEKMYGYPFIFKFDMPRNQVEQLSNVDYIYCKPMTFNDFNCTLVKATFLAHYEGFVVNVDLLNKELLDRQLQMLPDLPKVICKMFDKYPLVYQKYVEPYLNSEIMNEEEEIPDKYQLGYDVPGDANSYAHVIKEDPDRLRDFDNSYYKDEDAIAFMGIKDDENIHRIYVADEGGISHENMVDKLLNDGVIHPDDFGTAHPGFYDACDEIRTGRWWQNNNVISFWDTPMPKSYRFIINDVVNAISRKYGIDLKTLLIECWGEGDNCFPMVSYIPYRWFFNGTLDMFKDLIRRVSVENEKYVRMEMKDDRVFFVNYVGNEFLTWEEYQDKLRQSYGMVNEKTIKNDKGEKVPEKCDKCGSDVVLQIHGEPVYVCKKCGKYFGTMPFPKTLKENRAWCEAFDYKPYLKSITKFLEEQGLEISPWPRVILHKNEQEGLYIKTGYYDPADKEVHLFIKDRHPKDVLRSFVHEMIHHNQNIAGVIGKNGYKGETLDGDEELQKLERDAYLRGNIFFRRWTEELRPTFGGEKCTLNENAEPEKSGIIREGVEEMIEPDDVDLTSFDVKDELNPNFWEGGKLNHKVRMKLLEIADAFVDFLDVDWVKPKDIIITGSIANYNWNKEYSDIDLHIVMDFSEVDKKTEFVKEYFDSKRKLWNEEHNIKVRGYDVELYVQDEKEPHASSGVYSIDQNKWLVEPSKKNFSMDDFDEDEVRTIVSDYTEQIDKLLDQARSGFDAGEIHKKAVELFKAIKNERTSGFENGGMEYNSGNIIFKSLRRNGYLEKLLNLKKSSFDSMKSLDN